MQTYTPCFSCKVGVVLQALAYWEGSKAEAFDSAAVLRTKDDEHLYLLLGVRWSGPRWRGSRWEVAGNVQLPLLLVTRALPEMFRFKIFYYNLGRGSIKAELMIASLALTVCCYAGCTEAGV
jgi:hypothetical protein